MTAAGFEQSRQNCIEKVMRIFCLDLNPTELQVFILFWIFYCRKGAFFPATTMFRTLILRNVLIQYQLTHGSNSDIGWYLPPKHD